MKSDPYNCERCGEPLVDGENHGPIGVHHFLCRACAEKVSGKQRRKAERCFLPNPYINKEIR